MHRLARNPTQRMQDSRIGRSPQDISFLPDFLDLDGIFAQDHDFAGLCFFD
jgi:hypothetical protein